MPANVPHPGGQRGWGAEAGGRALVQRQDFSRRHKWDEAEGDTFDYVGTDGDEDETSDKGFNDSLDDTRSYRNLSGQDTYYLTEN